MMARRIRLAAALRLGAWTGPGPTSDARADMVGDWNARAETIAVEKRMLPPPNARVTAPGVTRRSTRLQDCAGEVAAAHIHAGFHYRFSTEAGQDMGRKIAGLAVRTRLLKTPKQGD